MVHSLRRLQGSDQVQRGEEGEQKEMMMKNNNNNSRAEKTKFLLRWVNESRPSRRYSASTTLLRTGLLSAAAIVMVAAIFAIVFPSSSPNHCSL
jgi:hypothetical protein